MIDFAPDAETVFASRSYEANYVDTPFHSPCIKKETDPGLLTVRIRARLSTSEPNAIGLFVGSRDTPVTENIEFEWIPCEVPPVEFEPAEPTKPTEPEEPTESAEPTEPAYPDDDENIVDSPPILEEPIDVPVKIDEPVDSPVEVEEPVDVPVDVEEPEDVPVEAEYPEEGEEIKPEVPVDEPWP